jgi:hypothetical protein
MAKLATILGSAFDSSAVEPSTSRDGAPLPAGVYPVEITGAEIKELSKKNGFGLNLEFTVTDGPHARRKVWQLLNIKHENEQTEQIAQSQLSALCRAVGITKPLEDTDDLFQRTLQLRTKVRDASVGKDGKEYPARAEPSGYEPIGAVLSAPAPAARAGGISTGSTPPWKKKAA